MRQMREAIGPDIKLMCDINQRWRPEQAIDIGRRVEDAGVGLFWLEDVTTARRLRRPRAGVRCAVDAGRRRRVRLGHRAVPPHDGGALGRCLMIDLVRVGGITQWLKVAGMAEAFNLPVVSHLIPEVHVHLIGAIPNGLTVEYMPWLVPTCSRRCRCSENGELAMPTEAGPRPRIRPGDARPVRGVTHAGRGADARCMRRSATAGCSMRSSRARFATHPRRRKTCAPQDRG